MKKSGRLLLKDYPFRELEIVIFFKEEIEENNLFLAASLTYFCGVVFAFLTQVIEGEFGIILILTSIMAVWYIRDRRKKIRRDYKKRIDSFE